MTQASVERTLGQILAKVEGLEKSIDKSDASRVKLHSRIDDLVDRTGELEGTVAGMKTTLTKVKQVTDEVIVWKMRGMGALAVTGIAASALTSLVWGYWREIVQALKAL